ncbi:hypothetical protein [uncultured Ruminococcus sp.]|uniref:hypothetical protein n=1 Tax=uncultured Ruminococcus sp. TaxID=165186 RepID=UPI0025DDE987|nr:hypothetical protein [uncultured Ruminococcus sp.]
MLLNINQFSDLHFIKQAVRDLMELPLEKLTSYNTPAGEKGVIDVIAEQIEKYFHIRASDCMKMTFGELVALMVELDTYAQIINVDTDSDDEIRCYSAYVRKMLVLNRQLPEVQIYNAISFKDYLDYLDTLCIGSNTRHPANDKQLVFKLQMRLENAMQQDPTMSLGSAFDILDRKACAFWIPWCIFIDDYVEQIRDAYDMRWWLISSASDIILSYPYNAKDIIEHYNGDLPLMKDSIFAE